MFKKYGPTASINATAEVYIKTNIQYLKDHFQIWFKNNARFYTIQKMIILDILTNKNPILAIIPTGNNKSLLFLLPVNLEAALYITIIIIPILALYANLVQQYTALSIIYCA